MIRIYGASDDIIVFEDTEAGFAEEYYGETKAFEIGDSDFGGVQIKMSYLNLMPLWSADICQIEEGVPIPFPVTVKALECSVFVEVDAPRGVTIRVLD